MTSARRALVEFTRSHADDDEIVYGKYGPYPGVEAFAEQLLAELAEGGVHIDDAEVITTTLRERQPGLAPDNYTIHIWLPAGNVVHDTPAKFASYLQQRGYDEGGTAGWFRVLAVV